MIAKMITNMKMLVGRIRGFSTPVGGISWQPTEEEPYDTNRLCMTIRSPQMLRWKG